VRAIVLDEAGTPQLKRIPRPQGEGDLVRVRACGLCGTDVQKIGRMPAGTVLGHEVVAELDDGRRVALLHHLPCGDCERCRAGHESTCVHFRRATIEPGGFAEVARARDWIEIPTPVDNVVGTFAEPLACVLRGADALPRGRALVLGCGFVGLLWVQVLARRGDEVFATDPVAERVELARSLGASTLDGPVDVAVLCAPAGIDDALAALAPGGTLLVFAAGFDPVPIDLERVLRAELRIVGSCSATPRHMLAAVNLLPSLKSPPTVVLPLERFDEGVDIYRRHEAVKVVFTP
jgi:L-iditol 2-dehydrogenase